MNTACMYAAHNLWELGLKAGSQQDLAAACRLSDMNDFGFGDDFFEQLWAIVSDVKQRRLLKVSEEPF
jgi:hypothetical protein